MSRLSLSVLAELNGVIFSEANSLFSGWQVLIIFVSVQASSSSLIAPQWRINGSLLFSFVTPSPLIPLYKGESPFFVFDFSQNFFWFLEHSLQKWEKRCWSSLSARFALTTESQLVSSHTWLLLLFTPRSPPPAPPKKRVFVTSSHAKSKCWPLCAGMQMQLWQHHGAAPGMTWSHGRLRGPKMQHLNNYYPLSCWGYYLIFDDLLPFASSVYPLAVPVSEKGHVSLRWSLLVGVEEKHG